MRFWRSCVWVVLCVLALPLWSAELPRWDLDRLYAQRLPADSHLVRMETPQTFTARAYLDSLPKRGKTVYVQDALAYRGLKTKAPVNHKLMLRTAAGARLMAYVDDATAARLQKELTAGDLFTLTAMRLWQSRHGPGLLLTDFQPATWQERLQAWWAQQ